MTLSNLISCIFEKSKAPVGIAMGEKKREKNQKEGTCEELFDSIDVFLKIWVLKIMC